MQRKVMYSYQTVNPGKQAKPRGRSAHPESKLQQVCVRWFRVQYPKCCKLLFAVPNGGARSKAEASIMQGEGVVSGVCDLVLAIPRGKYHGLFIEMKFGDNKLTVNQLQFIEAVMQQGYKALVCYSFEEFQKSVNEYMELKNETMKQVFNK